MKYRYTLSRAWIDKVRELTDFANGGTQVSIRTTDGNIYRQILISNSMHVIAMRGFSDLPFDVDDIEDIFQTDEDKNPADRTGWECWDDWPAWKTG